MSIFEQLRKGFEELNSKTEEQLQKELAETKDEYERKAIEKKIADVKKHQEKQEAPKQETLQESMERRLKQREENVEKSKQIKRQILDRNTGLWVEVDIDPATGNAIKK